MKRILEVCIDSVESGIIAEGAGADRVELCDNLYEGGTTPSLGIIRVSVERLGVPVNVIIRPRGGDFLYSNTDFDIMKKDIAVARNEGVAGVVLGILLDNGRVDIERTRELVELARPMSVTFHRAFDMTPDPFLALEQVIVAGADRLLTSAHGNFVYNNAGLVRDMINQSEGRIIIMPGAGINENNIADIINKTNATEYHLSGRKPVESRMVFRKNDIFMGGIPQIPEYTRNYADHDTIKKIRDILDSYV